MGTVAIAPPDALCGIALNCSVVPRSRLLLPGVKVILAGVGRVEVVVLLPPQPTRPPKDEAIDKTANTQETNRRMHPPRLGKPRACAASLCICWKTFSVEATPVLGKRWLGSLCLL